MNIERLREYPDTNTELARRNFAAFIQELEDIAQGIDLPVGIPQKQPTGSSRIGSCFLVRFVFDRRYHSPLRNILDISATISVGPAWQGYATCQLALVLDEARRLKLPGVMITIMGRILLSTRD